VPRRSRCKRPRSGSAASKHIPLRILAPLYKVGVLSLEVGHHFGAAILQHRNIKKADVHFGSQRSRSSERDSNPKEPALQVTAPAIDLFELY